MAQLSPNATPARILLVRHGETAWSAGGRHTGRTDVALTDEGRRQAEALTAVLRSWVPDGKVAVFSSPLQRSTETCRLALRGAEPEIADGLVEWDYGSLEGLTTAEIRSAEPDWDLFTAGTPDGESIAQVVARCNAFVAKVERVAAGATVIAFAHGHVGRVLTALLIGWPTDTAAKLYNDTGSVGVVDLRRGEYVLAGWNLRGR